MEEYKMQFVLNLLAYAVQRDIAPDHLCRLCGINFQSLKNGNDIAITSKQLHDLWTNAVQLTNDHAFGLHFGESLQLAALGVVGQIIQSSKTVGEGLTHATSMAHLITNAFSMEVTHTGKSITLTFVPDKRKKEEHPFELQQVLELFMVFSIHELDGLTFEKIKPVKIKFPYNELTDLREYERVLRCKPQRSKDEYSMEFDGKIWDEPIITANFELQRVLLEKVTTSLQHADKEVSLSEKIINYLTANAYLGIASLEDTAANLNTSPRTLQRRLQQEGISYQQLADSVRKSIALHYLQSGNYAVKEVSYILGYNELSAFIRAFKRWTGTTPLEYKKDKITGHLN
jgi:AraC-like DNA-binding protein